jgi:hypothetical protein
MDRIDRNSLLDGEVDYVPPQAENPVFSFQPAAVSPS